MIALTQTQFIPTWCISVLLLALAIVLAWWFIGALAEEPDEEERTRPIGLLPTEKERERNVLRLSHSRDIAHNHATRCDGCPDCVPHAFVGSSTWCEFVITADGQACDHVRMHHGDWG